MRQECGYYLAKIEWDSGEIGSQSCSDIVHPPPPFFHINELDSELRRLRSSWGGGVQLVRVAG